MMSNQTGNVVPSGIGNGNYHTGNPKVTTLFYHHPGAAIQSMYQSDGESGIISQTEDGNGSILQYGGAGP